MKYKKSEQIPCLFYNLEEIMRKKNITIDQLAIQTNLSIKYIKKIYENKICKTDTDVLARICYVLNCEIGDLIKMEEKR